jgi:CheY-like chemotaxis protein
MARRKCRVLVVEDEALVSLLIEDMILDLGTEVIGPAATVREALALLESEWVDAAVLDIRIDGEVTYPVAEVLLDRNIPVIFATGYFTAIIPDQFVHLPVLEKPFSQQDLAVALSEALQDAGCNFEGE